jgi:hypothetical protein
MTATTQASEGDWSISLPLVSSFSADSVQTSVREEAGKKQSKELSD